MKRIITLAALAAGLLLPASAAQAHHQAPGELGPVRVIQPDGTEVMREQRLTFAAPRPALPRPKGARAVKRQRSLSHAAGTTWALGGNPWSNRYDTGFGVYAPYCGQLIVIGPGQEIIAAHPQPFNAGRWIWSEVLDYSHFHGMSSAYYLGSYLFQIVGDTAGTDVRMRRVYLDPNATVKVIRVFNTGNSGKSVIIQPACI